MVRIRFAPSPTGHFHIGGVRTALYCHLAARAWKGVLVLRIEDTDEERSLSKYETAFLQDLEWLGLSYDEGPYRQSERLDLYRELAGQLVEEGKAYPCFLSSQELKRLTEKAARDQLAPHAYHGRYRDLDPRVAAERAAREEYVIRFKNPNKAYGFKDLVRGDVRFPADMVGDFVIMRSNGRPVYNFCCAVDDWKMQISHVIRAEEHLNNTLRQLMLYEAFGTRPPLFAHCSLLVGKDRQKLSKRHGDTSLGEYKQYLPEALLNYLCLLGWTHPRQQEVFGLEEIVPLFDLGHLNKAPALHDVDKLGFINSRHMRNLEIEKLWRYSRPFIPPSHAFHEQDPDWQKRSLKALVQKVRLPGEFARQLDIFFDNPGLDGRTDDWENIKTIRDYILIQLKGLNGQTYPSGEDLAGWISHIKKNLKIKGKPLFQGLRAVLTKRVEGPDLSLIIPLTKTEVLLTRASSMCC